MITNSEINSEAVRITDLFLKHERLVRMLARSLSPVSDMVNDVVQEVFVELLSRKDHWDLEDENQSRNLLAVITRRITLRHWERRKRQLPATLSRVADRITARQNDSDAQFVADHRDQLNDGVDRLPEELRLLIRRYYYDGKTTAEIALEFHMSEDTVRRYLSRAREKLRSMLLNSDSESE